MTLKTKILREGAILPTRARPGDAGLDLYAAEDVVFFGNVSRSVPFGFALEIPEGYCGLLFVRSSLATKHGICLANGVGLIDSGYRGELIATLVSRYQCNISKGARVAQLVIMPYCCVDVEVVSELAPSERGEGGFGSTGR